MAFHGVSPAVLSQIGTRAFQQREKIECVFCVFLVCIYIDLAALNRYKLHVSYLYLYFNDNISTACIRVSVCLSA